jgi:phage N-6-adenine-methyltransferase
MPKFASDKVDYKTPRKLIEPLIKEFQLEWDLAASEENHQLEKYYTEKDDSLTKNWVGNCWLNPPFCKQLGKWVTRAHDQSQLFEGTKVVLCPVRSNTQWWARIIKDAEVRFITGGVNFNDEPRGLWLPICILIFGDKAKKGTFTTIEYKK